MIQIAAKEQRRSLAIWKTVTCEMFRRLSSSGSWCVRSQSRWGGSPP